jgi:hypothetical protein
MAPHSMLVVQGRAQMYLPLPSWAHVSGAVQPQVSPHGSGQHAPSIQPSPAPQQVFPQGMLQAQAVP